MKYIFNKTVNITFLLLTIITLNGCGKDEDKNPVSSTEEQKEGIKMIKESLNNNNETTITPLTIQNYTDAGVRGVNSKNFIEMNILVETLEVNKINRVRLQELVNILNAPPLKLKKTGQTINYLSKDDGHYQKGLEPNYTRDDINNIVNDHVTLLQWQDNNDVINLRKSWKSAIHYCAKLKLGSYTNWRLPRLHELVFIIDRSESNPSIETNNFEKVVENYYWSATSKFDNNGQNDAWAVDFRHGETLPFSKNSQKAVRCVRNQ